MEALIADIRYSTRRLRRAPLFTAGAAVTVGLGLGIVCSVFTVFNAYVLRPFAVHDPFSLYEFSWDTKSTRRQPFAWHEFSELTHQSDVFSEVLAQRTSRVMVDGQPLAVALVTGNYFSMLRVDAAVGRTFVRDDATAPGSRPVTVLSHDMWRNRFGGDPDIVGKHVRLADRPFEVIGVADSGFRGLEDTVPSAWVPVTMVRELWGDVDIFGAGQAKALRVIGRMKADVHPEEAAARLDAWARQLTRDRAEDGRAVLVRLEPRATRIALTPQVAAFFSLIMAAFGLILLIACANVTGLMLARGMARQREIGIKLSLGAARGRVVRELLVESVLLAVPAAAIGAVITDGIARLVPYVVFTTLPEEAVKAMSGLIVPLDPDVRVYGFLILAALLSALSFGLVPALRLTNVSLRKAADGELSDRVRPMRLRNALVVAQLTICTVLFVSALGLLHGVREVARQDTRLDIARVGDGRVPEALRPRIVQALQAEPAVERLAVVWRPPFYGPLRTLPVLPSGADAQVRVGYNLVSDGYFDVFRIPVTRGRSFSREEAADGSAVAVVSEATARRLWPGVNPLDQSIRVIEALLPAGQMAPRHSRARVIGVAADVGSGHVVDGLDATCVYFPIGPRAPGEISVLIRGRADLSTVRATFDRVVTSIGGDAERQFIPLDQVLSFQTWPLRVMGSVASVMGMIALILALSGCYGLVSYLIGQRMKEFGIRMALGATSRRIVRDTLMSSTQLGAYGVAAGVLLAMAASQFLRSAFELVPAFSAVAYVSGAIVVLTATVAAAYGPCRRAGRIQTAVALRQE